jgi:hypothetical protein
MNEPTGFDFGRNPDRSMVMGISGLALNILGCLAGAVLAVLGLSFVACCFQVISVVLSILAVVWGKAGIRQIEAGELPESLMGKAKTGYWTGMVNVIILILMVLFWIVLVVLMVFMGIGIGALGAMQQGM